MSIHDLTISQQKVDTSLTGNGTLPTLCCSCQAQDRSGDAQSVANRFFEAVKFCEVLRSQRADYMLQILDLQSINEAMLHVIHRSIVITLEIVPSGVTKRTAERATDAIASEWLHSIGQRIAQQIVTIPSLPAIQVYMRQLPLDQGTHIQILLCWIVLQAQRQEISDFDRSV